MAGTHVYEEKRTESLRILEQSDAKRTEIHEIVSTIDARLNDLEGERDELAAYQKLDRTRRALEYCLYTSELKKVRGLVAGGGAAAARLSPPPHDAHTPPPPHPTHAPPL